MISKPFTTMGTKDSTSGATRLRQSRDGRAEVSAWVVPEFLHQGMSIERPLHHGPLHAPSAPVHEPHLAQAGPNGGVHVLFDHGRNIRRRERMKIELGFDGHYVHDSSTF